MQKKDRKQSITLKDIAREAGVSVGTASNAINRQDIVSSDLRMRVEKVIEKLGYHPSALARSIKKNRTLAIGLIIPKIKNAFYVQIIDAVEKLVKSHGYTLILGNSDDDLDTELRYLRTFAAMRIDGLILATVGRKDPQRIERELNTYEALGIPVVLIVRGIDQAMHDTIVLDNENGVYRATTYALDLGHRHIAIISSAAHTSASKERIDGYLRAMRERHYPCDQKMIRVDMASPENGYFTAKELLDAENRPTLLLVATSSLLIDCLRAIHDLGLRIPDDLSLICFDDPDWSPYLNPSLTAIRPDTEDLCSVAVRFLLERIENADAFSTRTYVVKSELIVRASVKSLIC